MKNMGKTGRNRVLVDKKENKLAAKKIIQYLKV
jgi:hypothetical protein